VGFGVMFLAAGAVVVVVDVVAGDGAIDDGAVDDGRGC